MENKEKEQEIEQETKVEEQEQQEPTGEPAAENESKESSEDKVREINDKYLRLYSDFENFRKRTAKERLDLINSAGSDVIKSLLPVCDDFERAIASNENSEDIESIKEGFALLHQKLVNVLTSNGVKPMDSKGKVFDVDEHEALTKIPAPEEDLKGKIVDVVEKGYYLNDKVIRFAKVVVGE